MTVSKLHYPPELLFIISSQNFVLVSTVKQNLFRLHFETFATLWRGLFSRSKLKPDLGNEFAYGFGQSTESPITYVHCHRTVGQRFRNGVACLN